MDSIHSLKHIWGIKSGDDISGQPCCIDTLNDIEILYIQDDLKYLLSIETIYQFSDGVAGQQQYIKRLFDEMTKWMVESCLDADGCAGRDDCGDVEFDDFSGIYGDSVMGLYRKFKCMVEKFCKKGKDK